MGWVDEAYVGRCLPDSKVAMPLQQHGMGCP